MDGICTPAAHTVPILPPEIWEMVLGYLRPHEEYQAAVVCRDWHVVVQRRREGRGANVWRTWIGAFCNSIARLVWARADGCPWDSRTCLTAAGGGAPGGSQVRAREWLPLERVDVQCCRWRRPPGGSQVCTRDDCPWDEATCRGATLGGHLELLKYAHENGCPWNEVTCRAAAQGGHLDLLKYARANGCPCCAAWRRSARRFCARASTSLSAQLGQRSR